MARILLAEDDDSMRDFLAKALERAGHEVERVADGEEGLAALGETPGGYDLLLTDIVMPGVDGIELARRAAEVDPGLKIMFITGFAAVALSAGSNAPAQAKVLSKPSILMSATSRRTLTCPRWRPRSHSGFCIWICRFSLRHGQRNDRYRFRIADG